MNCWEACEVPCFAGLTLPRLSSCASVTLVPASADTSNSVYAPERSAEPIAIITNLPGAAPVDVATHSPFVCVQWLNAEQPTASYPG